MNSLLIGQVMESAIDRSNSWSDVFVGMDADKRFVLLIIAIGCTLALFITLAGIIAGTIGSMHRRRAEMDLKREMIERGMSADEIAKIIESAAPPEDATDRWIASWACKKKPG
jgi:hypothetical protein